MKIKIFYIVVFGTIVSSCKKEGHSTTGIASITLVNTVTGGKSVKMGSRTAVISNNTALQMALNAGGDDLYVWPIGDSTHPYYTYSKFNAADHDVYSLFLGGTVTAVAGVLIKEDIPYWTDSTGGIRFINLSPNSPPLNINLSITPTVNEVSNLVYKQYTEFKSYPALAKTTPYIFQIKNASTGALLLTYSFNTSSNLIPRFSNITLVIRGMVGGSPVLGITRIAQDR